MYCCILLDFRSILSTAQRPITWDPQHIDYFSLLHSISGLTILDTNTHNLNLFLCQCWTHPATLSIEWFFFRLEFSSTIYFFYVSSLQILSEHNHLYLLFDCIHHGLHDSHILLFSRYIIVSLMSSIHQPWSPINFEEDRFQYTSTLDTNWIFS